MRFRPSQVIHRLGRRSAAVLIAAAIVIGGVSFSLGQSINSSGEVKIVAQKLDDGRIEFGLEQDGERILPRSRFFPADARVGRWLKSSAISIEQSEDPAGPSTNRATDPETFGNWEYFTGENVDGELWGYHLVGTSSSGYSWEAPPSLFVRCSTSGNAAFYIATSALLFNDYDTDRIAVSYRLSGQARQSGSWWSDEEGDSALFASNPVAMARWLRLATSGSDTLHFSATDDYSTYSASFEIAGVRSAIDALTCFD